MAYFDENATRSKGIWDDVIGCKKGIGKSLQDLIKKINPKKIALNFSISDVTADGLSYGMWLILQEILADYANKFCSSTKIVNALRGRKTDTEVELITKACELTEEINQSMTKKFKVGMSEFEVQEKFYEEMETHGVGAAWQKQGCPSVDAGPYKELGHDFPRKNCKKMVSRIHAEISVSQSYHTSKNATCLFKVMPIFFCPGKAF